MHSVRLPSHRNQIPGKEFSGHCCHKETCRHDAPLFLEGFAYLLEAAALYYWCVVEGRAPVEDWLEAPGGQLFARPCRAFHRHPGQIGV